MFVMNIIWVRCYIRCSVKVFYYYSMTVDGILQWIVIASVTIIFGC